MSRSYKKHPYGGDRKDRREKQLASKKVRKVLNHSLDEDFSGRKGYKKMYPTWDICDYFSRCTFADWMAGEKHAQIWKKREINEKEERKKWEKWYKRK